MSVLGYAEAEELVRSYAHGLPAVDGVEQVELLHALGRVLAESVFADRDQPAFRRSTRDGYACRAADAEQNMRVLGMVKAGERWPGVVGTGEAVEVMTGAPVPEGADCVVMVEHVTGAESGMVQLAADRQARAGANWVAPGVEARAGAVLVPAGVRVGVAQVAAAASAGRGSLAVHRRVRVAVLATGDELVGVDEEPGPQQIRNSNSYSLAAGVLAAGGEPLVQRVARDTRASLRERVGAALGSGADMLLLSGGVSAGKYDLVEESLGEFGARWLLTGVRMQPGKPVAMGQLERAGRVVPVLGLPGNPVSTTVTFLLFAAPVLAALGGERGYRPRFAEARLEGVVERKAGLRRFLPAVLTAHSDAARVCAVPWQGSGDVAGTAGANCFVVVPEGEGMLAQDTPVRVLLG